MQHEQLLKIAQLRNCAQLSNPDSARGTAARSPSAVSSLGGFRTPAPGARGNVTHRAGIRNPSHERSFHNRALLLKITQPSGAPPRPPLDHYLKPSSGIGQERLSVNRGP